MAGKSALVLEGGALRSLFTSGVLDVFIEQDVHFDCVIGTSAGSLCGVSYITRQKGRTAGVNIGYCDDKQYISLRNRFRYDGVFNLDYLFEEPRGRWDVFDEAAYLHTKTRFLVCATRCESADAVYFENPRGQELVTAIKASCSMPVAAKIIPTEKGPCLDGGIAAAIPFEKALQDGYEKVVVVKTQADTYQKQRDAAFMRLLSSMLYLRYPALRAALSARPQRYNAQLQKLKTLEKEGRVFVLAPAKPVQVSHTEQDKAKLEALYEEGLQEGRRRLKALRQYLG
ncbi:patatin family protein [Ruminococcaceae bacterium OttesenSCG-928-I18]|nr:patatin family protein [Ruminococcaceae bacterium OttesenSCG-928-I18]